MADVLRVGVIGLGWAGEQHLLAFRNLPGVVPVALAGMERDRRELLGREAGVVDLYEDYTGLIAREDVDAVSVCTPNYLHAPISIAALESGKHVLCEKPLARTAAEARSMSAAAVAANRILWTVFDKRYYGHVEFLRRQVAEGALGRIYYAKGHWLRAGWIPGPENWFANKDLAGGGPLIDLGVHVIDLLMHVLGDRPVLTVSASTYSEIGEAHYRAAAAGEPQRAFDVEDIATAFLRLEGDVTVAVEASWCVHKRQGDELGVTLYGTEGSATLDVGADSLQLHTAVGGVPCEIRPESTGGDERHQGVVRDFVRAIRGGDWASHRGLDGIRRAEVIDACYASALERREIALEPQPTEGARR
jgi:predicted dehydrogenase